MQWYVVSGVMMPSERPAIPTTILKTEQGWKARCIPSAGLMSACTRPVNGSIATTAPCALPSPARAASPTATSQAEALAGSTTDARPGLAARRAASPQRPLAAPGQRHDERPTSATAPRPTSSSGSSFSTKVETSMDRARRVGGVARAVWDPARCA